MTPFSLKIVTPDGMEFEGQAEEVIVRTVSGDIGILAGHTDCVAPLGMGRATVVIDGQKRYAACIGGMLSVLDGAVRLVATTWEWAEDIDAERAKASQTRAEAELKSQDRQARALAEARLRRSLVRQRVAAK